jgi:hypothetical protein
VIRAPPTFASTTAYASDFSRSGGGGGVDEGGGRGGSAPASRARLALRAAGSVLSRTVCGSGRLTTVRGAPLLPGGGLGGGGRLASSGGGAGLWCGNSGGGVPPLAAPGGGFTAGIDGGTGGAPGGDGMIRSLRAPDGGAPCCGG